MKFYIIKCIPQNLTPGCHRNAFSPIELHFDTSNRNFQEVRDFGFPKMYGRNCHPEW